MTPTQTNAINKPGLSSDSPDACSAATSIATRVILDEVKVVEVPVVLLDVVDVHVCVDVLNVVVVCVELEDVVVDTVVEVILHIAHARTRQVVLKYLDSVV